MPFPVGGLRAAFSIRGRISRVRYIACRNAILFLCGLIFIGLAKLTGVLPPGWRPFMGILILLTVASALVLYTLVAVRRAHDFNASGWLSLLSLIPLANLFFWFTPGSAGGNRHGEATPANSRPLIVSAAVLPLLAFLIFAWMAVMAYQGTSAEGGTVTEQAPASDEQPGQEP